MSTSGGGDDGGERDDRSDGAPATRRPGVLTMARQLLRAALVDDEDPRFPWWLPLPGLALAVLWAAYRATAGGGFEAAEALATLLWPGTAIFLLGTLATLFGWQLDID